MDFEGDEMSVTVWICLDGTLRHMHRYNRMSMWTNGVYVNRKDFAECLHGSQRVTSDRELTHLVQLISYLQLTSTT